jgi:hypothetical protein
MMRFSAMTNFMRMGFLGASYGATVLENMPLPTTGRIVVPKRRRILKDGGRKMSSFLMCMMMSTFLRDAKVAGRLCIGGPCKHVAKEGGGVPDNFLL